ncbi:hypothetical protein [Jeotgalicoccus sp. WY2]|uniref:hypothetical protein n=1 Tax=Jeotgalicoccus sp. WY2 TaxID=2708346 RepID=UPI001BD4D8C0|nr:hypothetical protein [Jeotgalicoccus sp. WY2]
MILLDISILILAAAGLFLFASGLNKNNGLSAYFGSLFVLAPMVWMTIGSVFLSFTPVLALIIIYVLQKKGLLELSKYKIDFQDSSRGNKYE